MIYGSEETKAADLPKLLAERGIAFPVLLDPQGTYQAASRLGTYPTATLLDADGTVAWQGQPYWRKRFADACESAIETLISR